MLGWHDGVVYRDSVAEIIELINAHIQLDNKKHLNKQFKDKILKF